MNFVQTNYGLLTPSEIRDYLVSDLDVRTPTEYDHEIKINECVQLSKVACKKITTASGCTFVVPTTQEFRVVKNNNYEYKKSSDVKVGDNLIVSLGSHPGILLYNELTAKPNQPFKLTEDVSQFAGWYLRHRHLYSERDVRAGNEKYQKFFNKTTENIFEDDAKKEVMDWMTKNIVSSGVLSKSLRTSRYSVVMAFINGFSHCSQNDDTVVVREHDHCNFYTSYLSLCRSVGINCMNNPNVTVRYWSGFVTDPIESIQDCESDSFKIISNSFYKLNGFLSK